MILKASIYLTLVIIIIVFIIYIVNNNNNNNNNNDDSIITKYPIYWGHPPELQTEDYIILPLNYGFGSSTEKHWILSCIALELNILQSIQLYAEFVDDSDIYITIVDGMDVQTVYNMIVHYCGRFITDIVKVHNVDQIHRVNSVNIICDISSDVVSDVIIRRKK